MMNNSTKDCPYSYDNCYFIDIQNKCLSNDEVLELVRQYALPTSYEWICIILYVLVFIIGTIGNLLVILVIQRNRSMKFVVDIDYHSSRLLLVYSNLER